MEFPSSYPYSPPTVKFITSCFHPNVDLDGNICLDILKDKWSASYDVRTILLSLQSLLGGMFYFDNIFNKIFNFIISIILVKNNCIKLIFNVPSILNLY